MYLLYSLKVQKKVRIPRELANSSIMTFLDPLNVCLVLFFFPVPALVVRSSSCLKLFHALSTNSKAQTMFCF